MLESEQGVMNEKNGKKTNHRLQIVSKKGSFELVSEFVFDQLGRDLDIILHL